MAAISRSERLARCPDGSRRRICTRPCRADRGRPEISCPGGTTFSRFNSKLSNSSAVSSSFLTKSLNLTPAGTSRRSGWKRWFLMVKCGWSCARAGPTGPASKRSAAARMKMRISDLVSKFRCPSRLLLGTAGAGTPLAGRWPQEIMQIIRIIKSKIRGLYGRACHPAPRRRGDRAAADALAARERRTHRHRLGPSGV